MPRREKVRMLESMDDSKDFIDEEGEHDAHRWRIFFKSEIIKIGYKGLLFRNHRIVASLNPGRWAHFYWDLFNQYSIVFIDVRDHPFYLDATGTVKGPSDPETGRAAPPCTIQIGLQLVMRVRDIERLMNTVKWKEILTGIILDYVNQASGLLLYDQYNQWSATLRDYLLQYLRNEALSAVGIEIARVLVTEIEGDTEYDKHQLKMYQAVAKVKEDYEKMVGSTKNEAAAGIVSAQSSADRAALLGVQPALLELSKTPDGMKMILANAELKRIALSLGIVGTSGQVGIIPEGPPALPGLPVGNPAYPGNSGPYPGNTGPYPGAYPGSSPGAYPSGPSPYPGTPPGASAPYPTPGADPYPGYSGSSVDAQVRSAPMPGMPPTAPSQPYYTPPPPPGATGPAPMGERVEARIRREIEGLAIRNAARNVNVEGEPWGDASGRLTRPYLININFSTGLLVMTLPTGFPSVPPRISITFNDGHTETFPDPAWSPDMKLNDILTPYIRQYDT